MPSPPQGFIVILPGEITQSDLDPQQPPAKLTSYPLTIGKDIPGPNESNYVANDNTGNLLNIINSDSSSVLVSALKMAIDNITLIRENGKLAINLASKNTWSVIQSFGAGLATSTLNLNGAGAISALVSSYNGRTGAVTPVLGDYTVGATLPAANESNYVANDNTGGLLDIVNADTSSTTLSADKVSIDDTTITRTSGELAVNLANENSWSSAQSFTAGLSTKTIDLNGAGPISALVSSFNSRTGAVVPAPGDYLQHSFINNTATKIYISHSYNHIGTITTGPSGVIFWCGSCLTADPSSGSIGISLDRTMIHYGIGSTSTGSTWSDGNPSQKYYPVILTGSASLLAPNTSYDVEIVNASTLDMAVASLNLSLIGF
jgi:hypothetical protein